MFTDLFPENNQKCTSLMYSDSHLNISIIYNSKKIKNNVSKNAEMDKKFILYI